ncbi:polysaccharide biosynthesis/export family protein [Phaeovulum vinaykumarii]|uniref:Polysaccharide export outer membrane protein n=1 Tax=Phaeovulum vinaykumarii TaxID=407234 RepID=A0A1N7KDR7_9RHOB|nr:polysaccharide biosynthesis/export family protein [Phaeovulum vinaykumarii]SIS59721.1 polysaccharide export outer membrane protein [Phaeovulum vinaykumarii]SOB94205.1 polysaccharide export outer membrane protein [Phaeovulum vinaykumarii]
MMPNRRAVLAAGAAFVVAGCSLPRGAALRSEVLRGKDAAEAGFAHYAIDRDFLAVLKDWPAGLHHERRVWPGHSRGADGLIITRGDRVEIAVWENDENSLLTGAGQPSTPLQPSIVSASGRIFVPYVGEMRVAGMSPQHARAAIQERLEELIPAAQVQLSVTPGPKNAVDLVSGVARPGSVPLTDRSITVLGAIAQGGGVAPGLENPQVRLIRGGRVYISSLDELSEDPRRDTALRAGDKLIVEKDRRYFVAMGAQAREELVPFAKDRISALEAVTIAGGLADNRANAKGVLILREYAPEVVQPRPEAGPDAPLPVAPEHARVVFSMDLTSADGLFSAQNFPIEPRDLVLATESPVVSARSILGLLGTSVGVANAAD